MFIQAVSDVFTLSNVDFLAISLLTLNYVDPTGSWLCISVCDATYDRIPVEKSQVYALLFQSIIQSMSCFKVGKADVVSTPFTRGSGVVLFIVPALLS